MVIVPLSEQVGNPLLAPVPAAAATPLSAEALLVEVPWELPPPSPDFPRSTNVNHIRESSFFLVHLPFLLPSRSPRRPLFPAVLWELPPVMNMEIAAAASTGPPPFVRPRAEALLLPNSRWRIMEVSASAPQPGVAQSRGVPSITVMC